MAATLTRPTAREAFVRSALRECARLRADPWDLALATWVPLLALALLAWMFSAGVPRELPVAVVDHDNSAASRELVRRLDAVPELRVAARQLAQQLLKPPASVSRSTRDSQCAAANGGR